MTTDRPAPFSRLLLPLLYAGTGITALSYEVLWTRMMSLMFGISIFGVVLTVTAFMAGLGAGSLAGARLFAGCSARQALLRLGAIEALLACYALLLPLGMPLLDDWLIRLGASLSLVEWQGLQGISAFLLLFPAAFAMGLAFPLALQAAGVLRHVVGMMYGMNALGGAVGACLPLLLLPMFGWRSALWIVAALGLSLALLACWLCRYFPVASAPVRTQHGQRPAWKDLLAYAGIGAAALILEVLWTRIYGTVLLRTEYVLAILLFVYLTGIGLGSVISRWMRSPRWFSVLPVASALLVLPGMYLLPAISQWVARSDYSSLTVAMLAQGGVVMLCTLPVTMLLGAWLPMLAGRSVQPEKSVAGGWWYGANSLGAAIGALAGGFVLVPWLGSFGALALAMLLLFVCGMRWVADRRLWLVLPALLLLIWPVRIFPPVATLLPVLEGARDLFVYEDAVALTHVVEQQDGQRLLLSDLQRMDASSDPTAVTVQKNQARLPLLLHAHPSSVLLLGVGTGITAAGALPFGSLRLTGVELSQGAITAAEDYFFPVNDQVMTKMQVVHDDVRRFLRADQHVYDVIVGDLFHPDMVGRANLLSLQQFRRVYQRLKSDGVFVQWLALNQFDRASLQVVMQTFRQVFGDRALVFIDGYRMALVGFHDAVPQSSALINHLAHVASPTAATGGEGLWTWLGRYWGHIPAFAQVPMQDEWSPVIEFSLPRVRYSGGVDPSGMWRWLMSWRESDAQAMQALAVTESNRKDFIAARTAAEMDVQIWMAELAGQEHRVIRLASMAHRFNAQDRWPALALADRMLAGLQRGLPDGMDREQALQAILHICSYHTDTLRQLMRLAEKKGDREAAQHWRLQLQQLSPLANDVRNR